MIKINTSFIPDRPIPYEVFKFNGGEVQVKLPPLGGAEVKVRADISSSDDIMQLLLVKDAIDRDFKVIKAYKTLIIPYLPYSRQDRVINKGEALSVKVMANLINSMNFDHVITWDAHSDVGPALINNCTNLEQHMLLDQFSNTKWSIGKDIHEGVYTLVSPDAGAEKKTLKSAQYFDGLDIVHANKVRNTKTGKIVATSVNIEMGIAGKDLLIVDDICDGGMTFIKLAEELNRYNPESISLYVTHGIFSKGYAPLFEAGISQIYTTNSFEQIQEVSGLKVLNL